MNGEDLGKKISEAVVVTGMAVGFVLLGPEIVFADEHGKNTAASDMQPGLIPLPPEGWSETKPTGTGTTTAVTDTPRGRLIPLPPAAETTLPDPKRQPISVPAPKLIPLPPSEKQPQPEPPAPQTPAVPAPTRPEDTPPPPAQVPPAPAAPPPEQPPAPPVQNQEPIPTSETTEKVAFFRPILDLIGKAESRGNYNAYYGKASNSSIIFTRMSIGEVLRWQDKFVSDGSPSSAVGKYQFIRGTLRSTVDALQIDHAALFDEQMQDRLAILRLEQRGANDFSSGKISWEKFAANVAKEWASFPRVEGSKPGSSYYDGDGLNRALVSIEEVRIALEAMKDKQ